MKGHINAQLKDVRKGWFNLDKMSDEVYKFSKLKKFLLYVNFMMEDTMRYMMQDSMAQYSAFLRRACEGEVTVVDTNAVETVYPASAGPQRHRPPLFLVDLVINGEKGAEGAFAVLVAARAVLVGPAQGLRQGAHRLSQNIVQVEKRVMSQLFWSHDPVMMSVHPTEEWIIALRAELDGILKRRRTNAPLGRTSRRTTSSSSSCGSTSRRTSRTSSGSTAACTSTRTTRASSSEPPGELDVVKIQKLSNEHLESKRKVEEAVPDSISIGLFAVSCKKVGKTIAEKHQKLADSLLNLMAKTNDQRGDGEV